MPDNDKKLEEYKAEVAALKKIFEGYKKAYEADGTIDADEQKSLDEVDKLIAAAEVRIKELLLEKVLGTKPKAQEIVDFILERVNRIMESVNEIDSLDQLNEMMNGDWQQAKNAFDSYSKSLTSSDRKYVCKEIERAKKAIEMRIAKLNGSTPDNEEFKKEIEKGLEDIHNAVGTMKTVEDVEKVQDDFERLKINFEIYKESEDVSRIWIKEMEAQMGILQKEMDEQVPDIGNTTKPLTWTWTISEYRRDVINKIDKLETKINKIAKKLASKFDFDHESDDDKDLKGRKKRLKAKIDKLIDKKDVLVDDNSKITDTEKVSVTIDFCDKYLKPTGSDKMVRYWGITDVHLLNERETQNDAGFEITMTEKVELNTFSDKVIVNFEIVRQEARQIQVNWDAIAGGIADAIPNPGNPIEWLNIVRTVFETIPNATEEVQVDAANETFEWSFKITTDPNTGAVTLDLEPETDHKILDELSYKKVNPTGHITTYEGDMEKVNPKFLTEVKKELGIK